MLVFGTQRDILRAWMFWKRNKEERREARQPTASPPDRTDSPSSSDHSIKQAESESTTGSGKDASVHEIEHGRSWSGQFLGRKLKGPLTTKDISQPVLREDLTFTVFGRAETGGSV